MTLFNPFVNKSEEFLWLKVSQLINHHTKSWNENKISQYFALVDQRILSNDINQGWKEDKKRWLPNKQGNYSVKNGYLFSSFLAHIKADNPCPSSRTLVIPKFGIQFFLTGSPSGCGRWLNKLSRPGKCYLQKESILTSHWSSISRTRKHWTIYYSVDQGHPDMGTFVL